MHTSTRPRVLPPFKSVAIALLFCVVLGPVGLLYASFLGGIIMLLLGLVIISSKLFFPILLLWVFSCIWGVAAVERHNKKIVRTASSH